MLDYLPEIIGFHLDLKYHMPNKQWLMEWLERLPDWGINTLLIEYEDKFPFQKCPFVCDPDAFTPDELKQFLAKARGLGIRTIPLVQSFAHLEFALSHEKLAHLREAPDVLNQICASNPEAIQFVFDLYNEVLEYHQDDEFFHCGADEVRQMGHCEKCKKWLEESGEVSVWLTHTKKLLDLVIKAGKRPIVWDDIFWKDPYKIENSGLPKETILHGWNYAIMELGPKNEETEHSEFGHVSGGNIPTIDVYQKAGYQTLAAPCINYGQLFPRHGGSVDNTRAWAQKVHQSKMLGMINTSWSSFHVPWQTQDLYLAVTGALCKDSLADIDDEYVTKWYENEYHGDAAGIASVLEEFCALWEVRMPDYKRPFSPMVYCYMNLILHYKSLEDRGKCGAYPRDWSVDFCDVYRRGVENVKKGDLDPIFERLDAVLDSYGKAAAAFRKLAGTAKTRKEEAEAVATFAELKDLSARIFALLVRGDGERQTLYQEVITIKPELEKALAYAFEPLGQHRMMRCWWEPMEDVLK